MKRGRQGAALLEAVLLLPVMFLLFMGMIELARVSYTYYTLQKILTAFARYAGTRQAVNFCLDGDTTLNAARAWATTGTNDVSGTPLVPNLTPSRIQVAIERVDPDTGDLTTCECSAAGCDAAQGGRGPDFVVVSITDGYAVRLALPFLSTDPIILRPQVRLPYRGT